MTNSLPAGNLFPTGKYIKLNSTDIMYVTGISSGRQWLYGYLVDGNGVSQGRVLPRTITQFDIGTYA
jgi:hypothetical protein